MSAPMLGFSRADFPPGFLWGAATSAYQIEGSSFGGAGPCHWDTFAATPRTVAGGRGGAVACDHYHRYQADLDLARRAGLDVWRFSTSWARVLPEGRGAVNPAGLDFYDRLVDAMLARGLRPALTLYHWDLPSALADLGGWANRDTTGWFADFADIIAARLGDRLWSVAPVNEPWCVSWLGHFTGDHAPGLRDIRATARAMHHVGLAHGRAIGVLRARGVGNLGAVCNFDHVVPADASAAAAAAADRHDALINRFFVQAMLRGGYPDLALDGLGPYLPARWQDDMATIAAPLDWLGVNYYTIKRIEARPGPWPAMGEVPGALPKTGMGWEVFPQGLHGVLTRLTRDFTGDLPLYVTENGMASASVPDRDRIDFLDAHVAQAARAMADGVPLRGYFIWSMLDNFEWACGYAPRFGLVEVDFDTQERRPRASWHALRAALSQGADGGPAKEGMRP